MSVALAFSEVRQAYTSLSCGGKLHLYQIHFMSIALWGYEVPGV
jgi:hypothetical protein